MDVILYGHNDTPGVVSVQQLSESTVRVYTRPYGETRPDEPPGRVSSFDADFYPFFFLSDPSLLDGYPKRYWLKQLTGNNHYRYIAAFPRWNELWEAVRHTITRYNAAFAKRAAHFSEVEAILLKPDPITQYLLQSGITHFKGLDFADVHRLQIAIHTHSKGYRASDPRKTEDRILLVALSDNYGWESIIDGRKTDERTLLETLRDLIVERDPDIIEGHRLFTSILPYLAQRCALQNVDFSVGRDGSTLRTTPLRSAEREAEGTLYEIAGRHLIDTVSLAQAYDSSRRVLEGFGLRTLAQHFGFVPDQSLIVSGESDTEAVVKNAKFEARVSAVLSDRLLPSSFSLARMVPLSFGALTRAGAATKIELLMLREYLRQKHSIPRPQTGGQTTGGYTDIFLTGVVENVLHADIESLYPSIMLTRKIRPRTDELGIFQILLSDLTAKRLEAKRHMQNAEDERTRAAFDVVQSALKVLINSFYGYLGYSRALFNDFDRADVVTGAGRELLHAICQQVALFNGRVIEVDTDGLFFTPPDNVHGEEHERLFVEKISSSLPPGITLALVGRYKKMLSYKKKNYALLGYDDKIIIRGSALASRNLELFARNYIQLCINCLLQEDIEGLHTLYVSFAKDIQNHRWEGADFCRTETIRDSWESYEAQVREGKRKASAAYEAAHRAGILVKPGDRISYYVTGTHAGVKIVDNCKLLEEWDPNFPDENTAYYLDRLMECSKKFEIFFEPHNFQRVFSAEDLFGFQPEGITLRLEPVRSQEDAAESREDRGAEFGIWLDESGPDEEERSSDL